MILASLLLAALPYLSIEILDPAGKPLAPRQGLIRVPNHQRIRMRLLLRVGRLEDPYADLFIKARNQHPDTRRVETVRLSVKRVVNGRREDVPVRIYSSSGGKNLTVYDVMIDLEIVDAPDKRAAEIAQFLDQMRAEAARQGAGDRFASLSTRRDQAIAMFDEMYVNNPPGQYEISATYSSEQPQYWVGRLRSQPVAIAVERKMSMFEAFTGRATAPR
ncbi:MAG: hypothetical protein ACREE7_09000 [Dongiaceae bacterium]